MKPSAFELIRPRSLEEALHALREHQHRDVKLLSGGQSLIPMMNFRVAQPEVLIDLGAVAGLDAIEVRDGQLCIGAMSRHADVKSSAIVIQTAPLVHEAYEHVAHATIRNRGTLGGNLSHADPASEMPVVMLTLNATLVLRNAEGERTVAAADFFYAPFTTAAEPDEILVEVRIPCATADARYAFEEVSLRKGDFAMSAVAVSLSMRDGVCTLAAIGVGGVSSVPLRAADAEAMLQDRTLDAETLAQAAQAAVDAIEFNATATISADYRRDLTRTLIERALSRAAFQQPQIQ
ncbi:xanthine dehydrogenase family protein subunit M [soil metagenome]